MSTFFTITIYFGLLGFCLLGTYIYILHAKRIGVIDQPNYRSSHQHPTPSGGGLVFAISLVIAWLAQGAQYPPLMHTVLALTVPGFIMIITGFWDDRLDLNSSKRLIIQLLSALLALTLSLRGEPANFSLIYTVASLFLMVWMINLFNFMDGIDGMAAAYSMTLSILITIFLVLQEQYALASVVFAITPALAGFLWFNWPPAKVFMGDTGSTFLGLCFAVIVLLSDHVIDPVVYLVLFAAFLGDASWTLLVRILTGQQWSQAHRLHCYQKLASDSSRHKQVTLLFSLFTLTWLFPIAYLYHLNKLPAAIALILGYSPVVFVCLRTRAGRPQ